MHMHEFRGNEGFVVGLCPSQLHKVSDYKQKKAWTLHLTV